MRSWAALIGDGTFSLEVVGVSSCQPELEEICGGNSRAGEEQQVLAILVPEQTNPYSPEVVRVQIRRQTVGYLARSDARALRAWMRRATPSVKRFRCQANIRRAWDATEKREYWAVYLNVCLSKDNKNGVD